MQLSVVGFDSWHGAANGLADLVALPETALITLASQLGVATAGGVERLVMIAKIEDAVATVTERVRPPQSTARQNQLLSSLGVATDHSLSCREADATIRIAIARERLRALYSLRPERGDRLVFVRASGHFEIGEIIEVSSIDRLGQIWAKGAGGFRALPQDLQRLPVQ